MSVKTATLFHARTSTEVRLVHLDATGAVFYGHRDLLRNYGRLAFKVGRDWFDVEGVVTGRPSSGTHCLCMMGFASMSSGTLARLAHALHRGCSTSKLEAIRGARQVGENVRPRGQPISRRAGTFGDRRLHELSRDALVNG